MKKWKTLSSEYLHRRPWLTVRKDVVQLPNGVIHDEYYVLEYPTWVNIIARTRDGKYVMVEQYRHGLQEIFTELVAGIAEPGEQPIDAARRELLEETGYGNGEWRLNMVICANPGSQNNLTYSFIADGVEKISEQHLDTTEDVEVKLLDESEVIDLISSDKMKQALMAAPLWKYFATRK
ncbi:MAG: NUDIX hydrolase [Muribaculaceae bacterium]